MRSWRIAADEGNGAVRGKTDAGNGAVIGKTDAGMSEGEDLNQGVDLSKGAAFCLEVDLSKDEDREEDLRDELAVVDRDQGQRSKHSRSNGSRMR